MKKTSELKSLDIVEANNSLGLTHYVDDTEDEGGWSVTALALSECPNCGAIIAEPNAIGIARTDAHRLGLVRISKYPGDGYYADNDVEGECDHCAGGAS